MIVLLVLPDDLLAGLAWSGLLFACRGPTALPALSASFQAVPVVLPSVRLLPLGYVLAKDL